MKSVRFGTLVFAFSLFALVAVESHAARPQAAHPISNPGTRGVTFRPASQMSSPETLANPPAIFGSIETVASGGAPQQTFARRQDVFLAVGPAATPCSFPSFFPDGAYYFQVTDASGKVLLSTDPVSERAFTVAGGVIASYDGATHPVGAKTACGSLAVGLLPYNDAGPMQALYVAWVTPAAAFDGNPSQVDPVCGTGCFHGFSTDLSLTAAFRVEDKASCDPSFCVSGVAYNDANGNGIRDPGETGLPGVPVRVESASGLVLTAVTASDGSFQICGLSSGQAFRVTSPSPLGFNKTGPITTTVAQRVFAKDFAYIIEVCLGNVENLLFPNQPIPGSVSGTKFEDLNANGVRDPGEPPLSGVTISLTPAAGGSTQTQVTDASGNFLFTSVAAGDYVLSESVPTGFTQTAPASGSISVTLAANGSSLNNLFGNFRGILTGTISGIKFNDLNGNGVRDPGEAGLAGVTIRRFPPICPATCPSIFTTTTAADGSFSFPNVTFGGEWLIAETVPSGFRQTAPPAPGQFSVTLDLAHQTVSGLLFGNQAIAATVSGTKFNDLNGNGLRDPGEPGIAGVTIHLNPATACPDPCPDFRTAISGADGGFTFSDLPSGTYRVSETVPVGFVQTAPGAGAFTVTVATGDVRADLLFGNQVAPATASISGTKWFDLNANGLVDSSDRPLEGITIILTDSAGNTKTTTSAADGTFKFDNLLPGTYVLSETLPPNFFQTFPGTQGAPGTYTITLAPGQQAAGYLFLNKC